MFSSFYSHCTFIYTTSTFLSDIAEGAVVR